MFPIIDDVGGFPLPDFAQRDLFDKYYWETYKGIINGFDVSRNRGLQINVIKPIIESLKYKINSGLEIINYPQLMDMCLQFLKPIEDYETEPFLIDSSISTGGNRPS